MLQSRPHCRAVTRVGDPMQCPRRVDRLELFKTYTTTTPRIVQSAVHHALIQTAGATHMRAEPLHPILKCTPPSSRFKRKPTYRDTRSASSALLPFFLLLRSNLAACFFLETSATQSSGSLLAVPTPYLIPCLPAQYSTRGYPHQYPSQTQASKIYSSVIPYHRCASSRERLHASTHRASRFHSHTRASYCQPTRAIPAARTSLCGGGARVGERLLGSHGHSPT